MLDHNAHITLQHLRLPQFKKLIGGDKACQQEIESLYTKIQALGKINSVIKTEFTQLLEDIVPKAELIPARNHNKPLIKLIAQTRTKLFENKKINSSTQRKVNRYLKALELHLINENEYKKLGLRYRNTLPVGKPKSEFSTYFSRRNHYLNPEQIKNIDSFSLVFVSGVWPNPYGHALLKLGDLGYIHIYDLHQKPLFIPRNQFQKFLDDSGQLLLGMQPIHVPNMEGARKKLMHLSQNKWLWLMYKNNCEDFAEAVVRAGGASCAQLDPEHVGDYYGRTAYPTKRFDILSVEDLTLTPSRNEVKQRKKNIHRLYKKDLHTAAKDAGMSDNAAKEYTRCRLKEGFTHQHARYKTDPSLKNFIFRHKSVIETILNLNPVFFAFLAPILIYYKASSLQSFKNHSFFGKKTAGTSTATHTANKVVLRVK